MEPSSKAIWGKIFLSKNEPFYGLKISFVSKGF
jgi:hypothetical protein